MSIIQKTISISIGITVFSVSFIAQNTIKNFFRRTKTFQNKTNMENNEARLILGITQKQTKKDLKDKRRKLLEQYHPDKGGSSYISGKINEAYSLLLKETF